MTARDLLRRVTGLNLSESDVARAVQQRVETLLPDGQTAPDQTDYLRLLGDPAELQALTELLVVPESWMFRDGEAFNALCAFAKRRLGAKPGGTLRILSVPCAGGEEPYSMAMALQDAGVARGSYSIDAVDLSAVALERARLGRYTRNAFRGGELAFRERHFSAIDGEFQIDEQIRRQVNFSQGNVLAPGFAAKGSYDVIFCRNLLIYFDEATTAAAIAGLSALLADDGMLFAGYAEVPSFCRHGFSAVRAPGAFALVKSGSPDAAIKPLLARRAAAAKKALASAPAAPLIKPGTAPATRPAAPIRKLAAVPPAAPGTPDAQALLARARTLADNGDYAGAARACRAALDQDPASADAYFILGMVSECEQQSEAAADHWRRCVYLQPDHYDALCHLALLAGQNGDTAQANAFKQRAARIYQRRHDDPVRKGKP